MIAKILETNVQLDLGRGRRMKVFDQLAGALGSLNLRKEERRKRKEEMLRDNDVAEEQARDGMVEMFRKSIQEQGNGNASQVEETQMMSPNNMQGMTKWGRMGNLNMSQGSRISEGSAKSGMFKETEDMTRSGRVKKATRQRRADVEVLRFLSLKLVGDGVRLGLVLDL